MFVFEFFVGVFGWVVWVWELHFLVGRGNGQMGVRKEGVK